MNKAVLAPKSCNNGVRKVGTEKAIQENENEEREGKLSLSSRSVARKTKGGRHKNTGLVCATPTHTTLHHQQPQMEPSFPPKPSKKAPKLQGPGRAEIA
jgi:hypothetical protein